MPSKTVVSKPTQNLHKRQAQPTTESVVHVTVTASGTVIYTQTATSYSYIPSYSAITPSSTPNNGNGQPSNNNNDSSSHTNIGAIVGGVVGGVAGIALIGLAFFLYSRKRKRQNNDTIQPPITNSYYQDMNQPTTNHASLSPTPRHFVAPFESLDKHELPEESKYLYGNGYYEDMIPTSPTYPKASYYSGNNSVASDSLPSTTVDRHVPDQVDYPAIAERHVPNAKEEGIIVEPPHSKE